MARRRRWAEDAQCKARWVRGQIVEIDVLIGHDPNKYRARCESTGPYPTLHVLDKQYSNQLTKGQYIIWRVLESDQEVYSPLKLKETPMEDPNNTQPGTPTMVPEVPAVPQPQTQLVPQPAPAPVPAQVAAAPVISSEATALPVTGYEKLTSRLARKMNFLKLITEEVDEGKTELRDAARNVPAAAGVRSFDFLDDEGRPGVSVSLPDVEKGGNRTTVKPKNIAAYAKSGLDLLPHLETTKTYKLTGEWITWFESVRASWKEQGIAEPTGLKCDEKTTLSVAGVASLQQLTPVSDKQPDATAAQLAAQALTQFTKDPTVKAKE